MKKLFKKSPVAVIVSMIVLVVIAVSVFAGVAYDFSGDGKLDNSDAVAVMQSIVGNTSLSEENKSLADFDGNDAVDVLDVIALKRYMFTLQAINDNWTVGIY